MFTYYMQLIQRIFEMLFGQLLVYLLNQMKWRNLMRSSDYNHYAA